MVMLKTGDSRAPQIAQMLESKAEHTGRCRLAVQLNPLLEISDDNIAESTAFALRS